MSSMLKSFARGALLLLLSLQVASAYYDPGSQRWLNRDPVGERGGRNLYNYSRNSPIQLTDAFGLLTWDGSCSETDKSEIKARLDKACQTANDKDCFNKCKIGKKGANAMQKACSSKDGEGPPVRCERSHQRCQTTTKGSGCGWTDPRGD